MVAVSEVELSVCLSYAKYIHFIVVAHFNRFAFVTKVCMCVCLRTQQTSYVHQTLYINIQHCWSLNIKRHTPNDNRQCAMCRRGKVAGYAVFQRLLILLWFLYFAFKTLCSHTQFN